MPITNVEDDYAPNWRPHFDANGQLKPNVNLSVDCAICGTKLAITQRADDRHEKFSVLPCGHAFGHACILHWFGERHNCPTCRKELEHVICGHHVVVQPLEGGGNRFNIHRDLPRELSGNEELSDFCAGCLPSPHARGGNNQSSTPTQPVEYRSVTEEVGDMLRDAALREFADAWLRDARDQARTPWSNRRENLHHGGPSTNNIPSTHARIPDTSGNDSDLGISYLSDGSLSNGSLSDGYLSDSEQSDVDEEQANLVAAIEQDPELIDSLLEICQALNLSAIDNEELLDYLDVALERRHTRHEDHAGVSYHPEHVPSGRINRHHGFSERPSGRTHSHNEADANARSSRRSPDHGYYLHPLLRPHYPSAHLYNDAPHNPHEREHRRSSDHRHHHQSPRSSNDTPHRHHERENRRSSDHRQHHQSPHSSNDTRHRHHEREHRRSSDHGHHHSSSRSSNDTPHRRHEREHRSRGHGAGESSHSRHSRRERDHHHDDRRIEYSTSFFGMFPRQRLR